MTMAKIKSALASGPLSSKDLQNLLQENESQINRKLQRLRRHKQIYICAYERQAAGVRGNFIPFYTLGDKDDVARPLPLSSQERNRRYRTRNKALISLRRYPHLRKNMGVWAGLGA